MDDFQLDEMNNTENHVYGCLHVSALTNWVRV
jgi:hypothetical protein